MPNTLYAMNYALSVVPQKAVYPPLGLLTIASILPDSFEKRLVDLNTVNLGESDLTWCDYVFISAMNVQEQSVREIISECKKYDVTIVAGGSLFTHEYYRFPEVDHFVLNEAELTLPRFIEDLSQKGKKPLKKYVTSEFADVTLSPPPDFSLVNLDNYLFHIVQYSRGCPYMCDFCDVTALLGRKPRTKESAQIIHELEFLHQNGFVNSVLFADDNLIGNKKLLKKELLPDLIAWREKRNPGFFFATQLTINLADDEELMDLLIDAGFRNLFIGIESTEESSLALSRKTQNLRRNQLENIQFLHKRGFVIYGGFIVGFETDTQETYRRQLDFINTAKIPFPIVNILKAPPGTELFQKIRGQGKLTKEFAFFEADTNIDMNIFEVQNGFLWLTERLYLPKFSVDRLIGFLKEYGSFKSNIQIQSKYKRRSVLWTISSIFWKLGIRWSERKYFWKLIVWTLRNKRKYFPLSLHFAMLMYQMNGSFSDIHNFIVKQRNENKEGSSKSTTSAA